MYKVKSLKISIPIIIVFLFCVIYVIGVNELLAPYYYVYNTPVISYEKDFSIIRFIICVFVSEILFLYTNSVNSKRVIVDYTLRFVYIIFCLPTIMSFCLFNHQYFFPFFISVIAYWLFLCMMCKHINFVLRLKIKSFKIKEYIRDIICLIIFGSFIFFIVSNSKNFTLSIGLDNVYEKRAMFKEGTTDLIVFLKTAFGGFIFPCGVVESIKTKKRCMTFIFTIFQIIMFSLARDKIYLFLLILSFMFGGFYKKSINLYKLQNYIFAGIGGLIILGLLNVSQNFIFNIFIRRFFVVPSWLNYIYYEFFFTNEKIGWKQDTFLIDKFFSPVYSSAVPTLIGNHYFNNKVVNPNAGMFAEAFSRFGYFGIIIYPILISIMLVIIDHCYKRSSIEVKIFLSGCLSISMANDVITSTTFVIVLLIVMCSAVFFNKISSKKKQILHIKFKPRLNFGLK